MLNPSQYAQAPVAQLLHEAALGRIGFDQRVYDAILARPEEAAAALLAHGENPPADSRLDLDEDILNILTQFPQADALPYITKLLREGYTEFPESLAILLRRSGEAAVEPLLEIYRSMEEEESSEVGFLLASLGIRDERIAALVRERLEFDMEDGAILAGLYGDPALIDDLQKLLAEVGQNREIEFAIETLKHRPPEPELPPYNPREDFPATLSPVFDVMTEEEMLAVAVGHEEESVRLEALDILEDLDLPAAFASPLLNAAQEHPSPAVRAAAFRALSRLEQIAEVQAAAQKALADHSLPAQIRAGALIAVLNELPFNYLNSYIQEFLQIPEAKADAVSAMWRSREAHYASSFSAFLDDPNPEVQREAIRGAGVMGDKSSLGKLREIFQKEANGDKLLRDDALFAYAMTVPTEISPSRMRALLKRIDEEAYGLSKMELQGVQLALDMRLEAAGKAPIFHVEEEGGEDEPAVQ
jgi:hypothetical protein